MGSAAHARRLVYLVHRWTGIGACLLMALWVVSGVVMLFVGYPKLLPQERLGALPALQAPGCCVPVEAALSQSRAPAAVRQITLTSIAGRPHYRIREGSGAFVVVDALTGQRAPGVDAARALDSARAFLPGSMAHDAGTVVDDRWTHSGALDAHRPLYRVRMEDPAATLLYVSSVTAEVVMDAPAMQRRWNYVGAWLHWLYMFRDGSRDPVWSWLVIVLSATATVGAVTGALAGIWRWRFAGRYRSGAKTPYRAFQMRWHHITGLVFGLGLVAWVFSGLMSMNPAGIFDARGPRPDSAAYRGGEPGAVRPDITAEQALGLLHSAGFAPSEIEWRVLAGKPYLLARSSAGATRLIVPAPGGHSVVDRWASEPLAEAGARLMTSPVVSARLLDAYDAYYLRRGPASMYAAAERHPPVLLLEFADAGQTRAYLDLRTGDLALSADRAQRTGRWLFNFLHSWDLPEFLRHAKTRDVALILLSAGALLVAITGTVIGWRRLKTTAARWRLRRLVAKRP